jgi:isochorismate hydrolase
VAIPPISPYPMPLERDLPPQNAPWQPDPARAVLLVHDMQEYFVEPFTSGQPPLTELVNNIRRLRRIAADVGVPVAYTAQPGGMTRTERGIQHDFWGPGMTAEPRHRRIIDELAPSGGDTVLTKWRYSAFFGTDLQKLLDDHGRDQLIICGVYAHLGCLVTAYDAFMRDVEPFFVADAVADFSFEDHQLALNHVTGGCAVTVWTRGLIAALSPNSRTEAAGSAAGFLQAR